MDIPAANSDKKYASRRLGDVDLDKIQRKFITVLGREANRLLDESFKKKLPEESAKILINYLKLLKQLQELELSELDKLTEEELEERLRINTKKGE